MAKLVYVMLQSVDGYVADVAGRFDWAVPDDEVHAFINARERGIGTYLYGRRMYETMAGWETDPVLAEQSPVTRDFAQLWRAADKVVYSRTLQTVTTMRTRLVREFDPVAVSAMKTDADRDLSVSGPELAGQALAAGLVDEVHLFLAPVVVGGGRRTLPDEVRLDLEALEERRFAGGMVYLRYAVSGDPQS